VDKGYVCKHFNTFLFSLLSQDWNYYATDDAIYYYKSCYSYSDSISMDAYWKTAEAFSIIAAVFGGVASFVSCISSFAGGCVGSKVLAFIFMFTALCQGLCFLFLKSDACQNNPIVNQVPELNGASLSCDLSWGANCTIAATVFWFVAGALMCYLSHQESKGDDDMEPDVDEEPAGKIDKEPAEKVDEEPAKKVDEEPEEMVDEEPEETEEMVA
jgi:hypothetical protein